MFDKKIKIEIKHWSGSVLFEYSCVDNTIKKTLEQAVREKTNLGGANLEGAYLGGAYLGGAYLEGADLGGANLRNVYLGGANLGGANLGGANLVGANLVGAKGLKNIHQSSLSILKFQKGKITAFKYLNGDKSPYQDAEYEVGKIYTEKDYCVDEKELCGKGLNVATLDWCLRDTNSDLDKTYLQVEFDVKDIVAIPYFTDGKFRVKKFKVIKKLDKKFLENYIKEI